ncbi:MULTISPECIES: stage 0 sporulation family protein [Thermoactinomyces]|jgi:cell fate regulator YaaT (PSP1 superfamily)|uniref:Stage 0 sporulation family protein n=1 Tax=Thermoactinomyces vulgaris TaxID=2026 RepID=A0ABS0QKK5_THEVU|nr:MULTISPECIES: stage 0 sporulation family protein [Thermoactinomyces]KFZ39457.1 stage 0 sporulation protein [Thermoactinomyces sp. Gus2-1]KYQ85889.1 stage 0 sporulation protein [Thermoactinomyces sp. AS95]MBA4552479.1 stage 0 sporulation family protein [Thermoactinomyces vulgaris]MBA4596566.1 stage 0 sporulation family protein [Thermoactinomyces vulgaris]MBH8584422.1 stage 0 sporulation family protein [Thermoactinomyces sp. CICC 10735]
MQRVIGVRFRQAGKIYFFDPLDFEVKRGNYVIVETVRGIEYGQVVSGIRYVKDDEVVLPLKPVIRIATEQDKKQVEENQKAAKSAMGVCLEKIRNHGLEMKLVDAEYTFDRNKIIFYFTADGRVDFRELVRDLAAVFRTRIELRQIGVRDEAKMLGGLGPCGRVLCCSSFLGDFEPVSIKMAKDQNLSLNPAKISGLCGRLMCCLKFENEVYAEAKQLLPDLGEQVVTKEGMGKVISINMLERRVLVELADTGAMVEYDIEDVTIGGSPQASGMKS